MASSSATALVAVALVAAANAVEWFPLASTGMEYMYSNQQVDYQGALAACAKFGPDASVASPTNQEAADMLYNLAPESGAMYQGRYLGLVNQNTNCKGVPPTFKWASGATYNEVDDGRWQQNEPNQWRCKEKCVGTGNSRSQFQNGLWNDLKCDAKLGYTCQRPVKTKTHELQIISLTHVCAGIKPVREGLEQCLKTRVDGSCDYDSLSIRKTGGGLIASAIVREKNPNRVAVAKNGATEMQETCIAALSEALLGCTNDCPEIFPTFQPFTTCADGVRNGFEEGTDCGGNDCAECTEEQLSRGPQGALTGADPHYVVYLARGVNLCYDVHGTPGDILNLISGKNLLVNSLVVSAPGSVSGTYHGAIGFVATAPSIRGMTTKDVLTVMSDGTVRFNNEMILASSNHSGAEMDLSFVAGKRMIMTMRTTGSSFLVTFVASSRGNAHLDLAVLNQAGLTGTHGIIGQFVNADASVSPKDDKTSILTVNGNTVEVVPRKMPEIAGVNAECFKYMDLQATGILKGTVADYRVNDIYEAPRTFNLFQTSDSTPTSYDAGDVDRFVKATVESEKAKTAKVAEKMHSILAKLHSSVEVDSDLEYVRNTLVGVASKKYGFPIEFLQAKSNEDIIKFLVGSHEHEAKNAEM